VGKLECSRLYRDAGLFEVPAGFTPVQQNPDQVLKQNKIIDVEEA
jgi:hypothetical protein